MKIKGIKVIQYNKKLRCVYKEGEKWGFKYPTHKSRLLTMAVQPKGVKHLVKVKGSRTKPRI